MRRNIIYAMIIAAALGTSACGSNVSGASNNTENSNMSNSSGNSNNEAESEPGGDASSSDETNEATQEIFAMDTYMTVTAYGEKATEAVDAAINEIERLDNLLSTGSDESEVGKLNNEKSAILSDDTAYLMERALEISDMTDGAFDVAIYPIMQAWGFPTQEFRVPADDELESLLPLADVSKINFDATTKEISFDDDAMEIDFGGIAKGYTSSRIMEIFDEYDIDSGLINLGGNVHTYSTKIDGNDWRVAIQDPDDESDYIGVLSTSDMAVITSGGYERYFEQDGKTYHHIIDPTTGCPADNGITSATIVSRDGTLADGLSTSLFIMGVDKASDFWKAHSDEFDFILLTDDGELYVSDGIADSFSSDYTVNVVKL